MPPRFAPHIQGTLLRMATFPAWLTPTGLSPSPAPAFQPDFGFTRQGTYVAILQHHIPLYRYRGFGLSCAAFGRPYSRHRFCFLFLPLLRCFSSGGSPSLRSDPPYGGPGGPIRRSRALRLHAPHPGLSQLATAFVGAQAEPSTGRLKPWTSSLQLVSTNYLCT